MLRVLVSWKTPNGPRSDPRSSTDSWVFLNGEIMRRSDAAISIDDRGFLFADGLYEVVRVAGGRLFRLEAHLDRFDSGSATLEIEVPMSRGEIEQTMADIIERSAVNEGSVYLQLTRGAALRAHVFPADASPTLLIAASSFRGPPPEDAAGGCAVITIEDRRWGYCEVKGIGLLPNVLAAQAALRNECYDAVQLRDGRVTEGSHCNVFCVRDGKVFTHPVDNILPGVNRYFAIGDLRLAGIEVEESAVALDEFMEADEVFLTGTTTGVKPVIEIDSRVVAGGEPGPITKMCLEHYRRDLAAARLGPDSQRKE